MHIKNIILDFRLGNVNFRKEKDLKRKKTMSDNSLRASPSQGVANHLQRQKLIHVLDIGQEMYRNTKVSEIFLERFGADAKGLFFHLMVYLWLKEIAPEGQKFTPPPKIEQAWCELTTFTIEYEDFCRAAFGHPVHHRPIVSNARLMTEDSLEWLSGPNQIRRFVGRRVYVEKYWQAPAPRSAVLVFAVLQFPDGF